MNSQDKMMRNQRIANHKQEYARKMNGSGSFSMLDETSNFRMEPFMHDGDSGNLKLAMHKQSGKKYIVKHAFFDLACNEYIYYALGNFLGDNIPDTMLLDVSIQEKSMFDTEYVVGIEYLDNAKKISSISEMKSNPAIFEQWLVSVAIGSMLSEEDGCEFLLHNEKLYRIDTSSSFRISHPILSSVGVRINQEKRENIDTNPVLLEHIKNAFIMTSLDDLLYDFRFVCKSLEVDGSKIEKDLIAKMSDLNLDYIDPYLNTLIQVYPVCVANYYREYIKELGIKCKRRNSRNSN